MRADHLGHHEGTALRSIWWWNAHAHGVSAAERATVAHMVGETRSCFLHGDYTGQEKCPRCAAVGRPEPTLARRLGWMADAMIGAKVGPQARFYSRERVDEIVLLLREAEKRILDAEAKMRHR